MTSNAPAMTVRSAPSVDVDSCNGINMKCALDKAMNTSSMGLSRPANMMVVGGRSGPIPLLVIS